MALRKNKTLAIEQSSPHHTRSTINNLHIIKSEIDKSIENKHVLGKVNLDITKSYDSV